jgi:hypothetical protein
MIIITWVTLLNKKKNIYEMSLYNRETSNKRKKKGRERKRKTPEDTIKGRTKSKSFYLLQVGKLKVDKEGK